MKSLTYVFDSRRTPNACSIALRWASSTALSFVSPVPNYSYFTEIALQPSGGLVVGGYFKNLNDTGISYLAQLAPNGAVIPTFNPAPNDDIYALAVQPDNKILVGGDFTIINGQVRHSIVRLNPDGSLDLTFSLLP